jgi:Ca2+-binding RTX toxin-like protein
LFTGSGGGDVVSYSYASSAIKIDLSNLANNTGEAAGDTYTGIGTILGTAYNDTLTGSSSSASQFRGGAGDDVFYFSTFGGSVTENSGEGNDTVYTASTTFTLGANVETLIFNGSGNATLTGNTAANNITGSSGDDVLIGGAGSDALDGGSGVNTASYSTSSGGLTANLANSASNTGDASGDTYSNIKNLIGSTGADVLVGDTQNNSISGGSGTDTITGGAGQDAMAGGANADVFVFSALSDSPQASYDTITDFSGDKIDLSAIDADATTAGNQAFHLDGTSGSAGDIATNYVSGWNLTFIDIWVDNDATVDATIALVGNVTLTSANFVF